MHWDGLNIWIQPRVQNFPVWTNLTQSMIILSFDHFAFELFELKMVYVIMLH